MRLMQKPHLIRAAFLSRERWRVARSSAICRPALGIFEASEFAGLRSLPYWFRCCETCGPGLRRRMLIEPVSIMLRLPTRRSLMER